MINHTSHNYIDFNPIEDDSGLMTVPELAEYLRIGKNRTYELLKDDIIHGFRIGSTWRVSKEAVNKYILENSKLL